MNSDAGKSRGRPALGKVVFKKRVTREEKELIEAYLAGRPVAANVTTIGVDPEREPSLMAEIADLKRLLAVERNDKKVALDASALICKRSDAAPSQELSKQNMALAENVAALEVKLATAEAEYEELLAGNTDPAIQRLRTELAKVKAHAKNLEQHVHG